MIYCFDIDGVICETSGGDYENAAPLRDNIRQINHLAETHTINLYTARGFVTGIDWRELTEKQLRRWGVKYQNLYMGKPHADIYVDDKAINSLDFF